MGAGIWAMLMLGGIVRKTVRTGLSWNELNRVAFGPALGYGISLLWFAALTATSAYLILKYIRLQELYDLPNAQPFVCIALMTGAGLAAAWGGLHAISGLFMISLTMQLALLVIAAISFLPFMHWHYVAPFAAVHVRDSLKATLYAFAGFAGMETAVLLLPFDRNGKTSGTIRLLAGTSLAGLLLPLLLTEVCLSISGLEMLRSSNMPTIYLIRLIRLPFLEQLDQFAAVIVLLRLLPILSLQLWAGAELSRRLVPRCASYRSHLTVQAALVALTGLVILPIRIDHEMDGLMVALSAAWFVVYAPLLNVLSRLRSAPT